MFKHGLQIGLLLFGMFFGAGNLIFPPSLGFMSGGMFAPAILGFLLSGIGMPVIALIIGTFNPGSYRAEMNRKISPLFSLLLLSLIYLSIGPLMAIPRTAATSFSIGVLPITGDGALPLAIFTILYFAFAWWLAITPTKLLARLGKVLTPMFAVLIVVLMITGLFAYTSTSLPAPLGKYSASAFGTGFIEGYNTMDALAGLAFGIVVVGVVRDLGVSDPADVARGTILSGVGSGLIMAVVYALVTVVGAQSRGAFAPSSNGGIAFAQIARMYLGDAGLVVLAVTVTVACLKTAVGLVTSCSQTFVGMFGGRVTYRGWAVVFTLVSFALANGGLDALIAWSLPVLSVMYPLAIVLIVLALAGGAFGYDRVVLAWAEGTTLPAAVLGAAGSAPAALAATPVVRAMARAAAALPLCKNQFVYAMQETSVVGYLAVMDLTRASSVVSSRTMDALFGLLAVTAIYFIIGAVVKRLMGLLVTRKGGALA